jgi:predicted ABC-type ATPase
MPTIYIIAGCNGAGKTTASYTVLPEVLHCTEFINADNIAKGLSPFNVEGVAIEAARIMLMRIRELIHHKVDFAFETTLASKSYISLMKEARSAGYQIHLIFFWLNSVELAKERVSQRVQNGGHNIPLDVIERRYNAGIENLNKLYFNFVDSWLIFDNSDFKHELVAEGKRDQIKELLDEEKFSQITNGK